VIRRPSPARGTLVAVSLAAAFAGCRFERSSGDEETIPSHLGVGRPATPAELAAVDVDVAPSGAGLPRGSGTAAQGAPIYSAKCAACHGANGEGVPAVGGPQLIGREPRDSFPFGRDRKVPKTIGNYWPYATTVFDYVRRTMPLSAPGSLKADEVYALTAYLLERNAVIPSGTVIDAKTLPAVRMPARDRFVVDDRKGGPELK
jgi:mono/diheme cytochrome c family protein